MRGAATEAGTRGFRPVAARRAFEEIARQIRERLASGALKAGDRLPPERELAGAFAVSRNTLREALRALEIAGLVELRKGAAGGAFIRAGGGEAAIAGLADLFRLGAIRPEHLTEARIIVGTEVARLASRRRRAADLAALEANVRAAEEATARGDMSARAEINYEFHRLLARATGNPVLIVLTDALMEMTRHFVNRIGYRPNRYVLPSRRRLLAHLKARDAAAAAREMETMLRRLQRWHLGAYGRGR
ncbi:MAG: GntR family transcriptional regulator [Burkholderiales bacterium]|nr:GntR family transcriptional regulator [Burkholderiales bacterium]